MTNYFRRLIFSFNIIAVILLGGAYLSSFISPKEAWIFAILGLSYPFILLLNIFFALFWLFQFNLKAFLSIGIILLGIPFFNQTFQFASGSIVAKNELRIASYNAGLFGYFQSKWHADEMTNKIRELKTDIFCVQEFLNINGAAGNTVDSIKNACHYKYAYFQRLEDGRKNGAYGMTVFSMHKIIKTDLVHFDGLTGNMCFYTDILIDTSIYRIYNVHLQSFKFKKQDYKFIEKLPKDNDEKLKQSKGILIRMKNAYLKRAEQVDVIRAHISQSPYPHFVVGDFNDPPVSYSYAKLCAGLKDAFIENGKGMGKTYIGIMPNFRIDYVLFPKSFEGVRYQTFKLSSDHSLLSVVLNY